MDISCDWEFIGRCRFCKSPIYYNVQEDKVRVTGKDCHCELEEPGPEDLVLPPEFIRVEDWRSMCN